MNLSYCFLIAFPIHIHPTAINSKAGIRRSILLSVPKDHHTNNNAAITLRIPLNINIIYTSVNWNLVGKLPTFYRTRTSFTYKTASNRRFSRKYVSR